MRKKVISAICLIIILTMLTGCGSTGNKDLGDTGTGGTGNGQEIDAKDDEGVGTLRLYESRSLETLNPHNFNASATGDFLDQIQGYLYRTLPTEDGTTFRIIPELADGEPIMVDDQGKKWEIKISPNAKWANGESIGAEDFDYSWRMLLDPSLLNEKAGEFNTDGIIVLNADSYFAQNAEGAESVSWEDVGIKVKDSSTLELTLEQPVSPFTLKHALSMTARAPVYKKLYDGGMNADKTDTTFGTNADSFMSSGPFKLDKWERDVQYVSVKNPESNLRNLVHLHEIVTKVILEQSTAVQLFESGQLDYVSLDNATYMKYSEDPRLVEVPHKTVFTVVLNTINEKKPILQDKRFRQALSYGINREELGKVALVEPADYYVTNYYVADVDKGVFYRDTPEAKAVLKDNYGYNPNLAKELFDEAMSEAGLDSIEIVINYHDGNESRKIASEYIQKALPKLLGEKRLTISLQALPSSQLSSLLRSHVDNPSAFDAGWTGSSWNFLDFNSITTYFHSETPRSKYPYMNDEYDKLVEELRALPESEKQKRIELGAALEAMLLEDVPTIPVYKPNTFSLFAEDVELAVNDYNPLLAWGFMWAKKTQ